MTAITSRNLTQTTRAAIAAGVGRGLVLALLALLPALGTLPAAAAPGFGAARMGPAAVPDRLLVGLREMSSTAAATSVGARAGGTVRRALSRGRLLVIDLPPGSDLQAAAARARMDPAVAFVEPDWMMYPALAPNDPQYPKQFHLPIIHAPEAWEVTTGAGNVVIASVDTGVDLDHPDLVERIWTNPGEVPGNGRDDDGNGFVDDVHGWDFQNNTNDPNPEPDGADDDFNGDADDQVNHGTLVAGLAAAVGNNGFGTAGVTWGARIMPVQVFPDDGGASVSQVIEGIEYALANGADIINLSIGGTYAESFTPVMTEAYEAGILVVAAAGNGGRQLTDSRTSWESPVCNDGPNLGDNHVFGVGATDRHDVRASFSNYDGSSARNFVEAMAPGEGLYGIGYYDPRFPKFSTYFTTNSGTSFSVPLVSGLAALLLGRNPGMRPADLMATIRESCDDIDGINPGFAGKLGGGRLNCARALGVELPPRPPRELVAADTPDDSGGSISLDWLLSLDDGQGANSVTEYVIRRRQGADGAFIRVARVPAGTAHYEDTTVTDGIDYYYLVRATDGSLYSDSNIAGPVRAINDGAPAPVRGVYAEDRPADNGGAIRVAWEPYTAPPDFAHFAIYRARSGFTSVAGMEPLARVTNARATEYIDATTQDGVDYFYAVTAVDNFGNENRSVTAVGPVQSLANGPTRLGAGMHFIGVPLVPADGEPAGFFGLKPGALKLARWSAPVSAYIVYSGVGTLPLELGLGYWLKLAAPLDFVPAGAAAPSGSLSVTLTPGWQQLGNPYFAAMNLTNATVRSGGVTMDLPGADAANVMRQVFWRYDAATNGYTLSAPFLGVGSAEIPAWEGFWARVEKSCTFTLPRPGMGVAATPRPAPVDGWMARVSASTAHAADRDNLFGVSDELARMAPLASPPALSGGVDLYFVEQGATQPLAARFAPGGSVEARWQMRLAAPTDEEVEVYCPDHSAIPSGYAVTLADPVSGATVNLRTGRYRTRLRAGESARPLELRLTRTGGALTLTSLTAQPTPAGGAEVMFSLSAAADCTVRVLNIAGRTVRVLERGQPHPAGSAQLVWDGRSDQGSAVPNGIYLVQVEAAAEDGTRTEAVRTLAVTR